MVLRRSEIFTDYLNARFNKMNHYNVLLQKSPYKNYFSRYFFCIYCGRSSFTAVPFMSRMHPFSCLSLGFLQGIFQELFFLFLESYARVSSEIQGFLGKFLQELLEKVVRACIPSCFFNSSERISSGILPNFLSQYIFGISLEILLTITPGVSSKIPSKMSLKEAILYSPRLGQSFRNYFLVFPLEIQKIFTN